LPCAKTSINLKWLEYDLSSAITQNTRAGTEIKGN
jgi:hypothetical protein